jgi:diguanylate cyclase (GGDEF)-like protein
MRVPILLAGRMRRRLLLFSLLAAALGSASLALLTAVLVLGLITPQAEQRAQLVERDLTASLTSFQPIYEAQRRMQLAVASGELRHAMVVDHTGMVIAASNQALVGESIFELASGSQQPALRSLLSRCRPEALGLACLEHEHSHAKGPVPWVGGRQLVRFRPIPLALTATSGLAQRGTLITEVDLQPLQQQAGLLALQVFAAGLVPLSLTCTALVLVVRRRLFPELLHLAQVDGLSGVLNRRAFLEAVEHRLEEIVSRGENAVVALIDLDHFKQINDRYGHAAGDGVILALAGLLQQAVRRTDLVGRLGGDEFALLIGTTGEQAWGLLERFRASVAGRPIVLADGLRVPITLSIGMAVCGPRAGHRLADLLATADASLYAAKDRGRNQVVALDRPLPDPDGRLA